jgi:hypothetical protein
MPVDERRRDISHHTVRHSRTGQALQDACGVSWQQACINMGTPQESRGFERNGGLETHPNAWAEIVEGKFPPCLT